MVNLCCWVSDKIGKWDLWPLEQPSKETLVLANGSKWRPRSLQTVSIARAKTHPPCPQRSGTFPNIYNYSLIITRYKVVYWEKYCKLSEPKPSPPWIAISPFSTSGRPNLGSEGRDQLCKWSGTAWAKVQIPPTFLCLDHCHHLA